MICLQLCSKKERQFGIQIPHRPVSWNFLDGCLNHLIDYPQMSDSITTTAGWISKFWRNSENVRHISSCIIVPFVCIIYIYHLQLFSLEAISGNLSFLNHMTIIPALACLDDACWTPWRSRVAPKPGADEQRKVAGRWMLGEWVQINQFCFFLGVLFSHFFPAFLWHIFQVERETHSQMTDKTWPNNWRHDI